MQKRPSTLWNQISVRLGRPVRRPVVVMPMDLVAFECVAGWLVHVGLPGRAEGSTVGAGAGAFGRGAYDGDVPP